MEYSNTERPLLEIYEEMAERIRNERTKVFAVEELLFALIAEYPETAEDYYAALKIIGGRDTWLEGKAVEIEAMKRREKAKQNAD